MTTATRKQAYLDGAEMARDTARRCRQLAAELPRDAEYFERQARAAEARAQNYIECADVASRFERTVFSFIGPVS